MPNVVLSIVVPTRNRAELAIRSAQSIASAPVRGAVRVVISDNSTDPAESQRLQAYVSSAGDGLRLVRPPAPLGMTAHWNFALGEAFAARDSTHFAVLTDRMLFKHGGLDRLLGIVASHPDEVIAYTYDRIDDMAIPIVYRPLPRSGELLRIESSRLLRMSSRMQFPSCLPRMLNSVSPREHLAALGKRFGEVFASVSPDFNFCYRTLDMRDSILFDDRSLLINYAQGRSNGGSMSRGVTTRDSADFMRELGQGTPAPSAPWPEFVTVGNAVVSEYRHAARDAAAGGFPEIDMPSYMDMLAREIDDFTDREAVQRGLATLRQKGWEHRMRLRLSKASRAGTNALVSLWARKFANIEDAIRYAHAHDGPGWRWLPHPALRFGSRLPPSA